jgi:hemerythrin
MPNTWNDSMQIGIPSIDRQHQQLINQMDRLVEAMKRNGGQGEIRQILDFLDRYVQEHFGFEEACMHRHRCPVAQVNQSAHQQFVATLRQVRQEFERTGPSLILVLKVNDQLLDWFVNHIRKIDRELTTSMATAQA